MRVLFSVIILFVSFYIKAQEANYLWIVQDTRLFKNPDLKSEFYGYFKYGSRVRVIDQSGNWSKVESDNKTIGFVPSKYLKNSMNYNDINIPDKDNPILVKDNYYGSEHMFITVAGLKARKDTNSNSKVYSILYCGDAFSITYFPVDLNDWVNISGSGYGNENYYVQAKYLGKRPEFKNLLKQFDNIPEFDLDKKKQVAERLVELAWNDKYSNLIPAYNRYINLIKNSNNIDLISKTNLNYEIAKALNFNDGESDFIIRDYVFLYKNKEFGNSKFGIESLISLFGEPIKIHKILNDECGLYISDTKYEYKNFEVFVDPIKNEIDIIEFKLDADFSFKINSKFVLTSKMTELEFINIFKGKFYYSVRNPHEYILYSDGYSISISFENELISKINLIYYC